MNKLKTLTALTAFLIANVSFAQTLTITNWYRPNTSSAQDYSAEVCFTLSPAPTSLTHVQVEVDKTNNRAGAIYNTLIGPQGRACLVVTSVRGTVEVSIPQKKLLALSSLY